MVHDQDLVDRLSELLTEPFNGQVFRATGLSIDPTAPSINGGRWAPPPDGDPGIYVLYTSLERDGAIAEICAFLADLTPIPKPRLIKVTSLSVTTARMLRLTSAELTALGVDMARYGSRDYRRTQELGAAIAFLGVDGLIAPSARWRCENLMIFTENHALTERLEPLSDEQIEWQAWARKLGILPNN